MCKSTQDADWATRVNKAAHWTAQDEGTTPEPRQEAGCGFPLSGACTGVEAPIGDKASSTDWTELPKLSQNAHLPLEPARGALYDTTV